MSKKSSRSVRARRAEAQAKKKKQRLMTIIIVVGGFIALTAMLFFTRQATRTTAEDVILPASVEVPPNADGAAWGPVDAPILIEEYGDFQ